MCGLSPSLYVRLFCSFHVFMNNRVYEASEGSSRSAVILISVGPCPILNGGSRLCISVNKYKYLRQRARRMTILADSTRFAFFRYPYSPLKTLAGTKNRKSPCPCLEGGGLFVTSKFYDRWTCRRDCVSLINICAQLRIYRITGAITTQVCNGKMLLVLLLLVFTFVSSSILFSLSPATLISSKVAKLCNLTVSSHTKCESWRWRKLWSRLSWFTGNW